MRRVFAVALVGTSLLAAPELRAQNHSHQAHHDEHHQGGEHAEHHAAAPLAEPGNAAFAAIQEVVAVLESDPNTDWETVDLEALRQHLVDMRNMTLHVEVLAKEPVDDGVRFRVRGTTPEAHASIGRALAAHGVMIRHERGWTTEVSEADGVFTATVTTPDPAEVARIRGLGYIGFLALGGHHTRHHWMIATGRSPH